MIICLFEEHILLKTLLKLDNNYHEIAKAKESKANFNRLRMAVDGDYNSSVDYLFKDMRNLVRLVLGEPVKEYDAFNVYSSFLSC